MPLSPISIWGIVALLGVVIAVLLVPADRPVDGTWRELATRRRLRARKPHQKTEPTPADSAGRRERSTPMKVTDPVCGMTFDEKKAVARVEHHGRTYYFCAEACRKQFEGDPDRYTAAGA